MHEQLKARVAEEGAATHSDQVLDYVLTLYKDKVGSNFTPEELRQTMTTVPRIELLREFHTKTKGRRLLMYRFDIFPI